MKAIIFDLDFTVSFFRETLTTGLNSWRIWLNNKNFQIAFSSPSLKRTFTEQKFGSRQRHGRLTGDELVRIRNDLGKRRLLGLEAEKDFNQALRDVRFGSKGYLAQPTMYYNSCGYSEQGP